MGQPQGVTRNLWEAEGGVLVGGGSWLQGPDSGVRWRRAAATGQPWPAAAGALFRHAHASTSSPAGLDSLHDLDLTDHDARPMEPLLRALRHGCSAHLCGGWRQVSIPAAGGAAGVSCRRLIRLQPPGSPSRLIWWHPPVSRSPPSALAAAPGISALASARPTRHLQP
jgi:hypothetical protein